MTKPKYIWLINIRFCDQLQIIPVGFSMLMLNFDIFPQDISYKLESSGTTNQTNSLGFTIVTQSVWILDGYVLSTNNLNGNAMLNYDYFESFTLKLNDRMATLGQQTLERWFDFLQICLIRTEILEYHSLFKPTLILDCILAMHTQIQAQNFWISVFQIAQFSSVSVHLWLSSV